MNNDQFRRLLLKDASTATVGTPNSTANGAKPPSTSLGGGRARPRTSVYMAPRNVKSTSAPPRRAAQFKSVAPKGSRLASGFVDRAGTRRGEDDDAADDVAARIAALEESLKAGEIDEPTFARLRDELTGGRLQHTHLVKGLDWKLLERVRRGEDVVDSSASTDGPPQPEDGGGDVDDELDQLEQMEVVALARESTAKKGELAQLSGLTGKRTRDEILAELKASRKRAADDQGPQLGSKFRKIEAAPQEEEGARLEIDARGREVLVVTEADGTVKRKVRRKRHEERKEALPMPDENAVPLGADVAVVAPPQEESDEGDIYADIGDDYDPLADLGDDDSSSGDSDEEGPPKATDSRDDTTKKDHGEDSDMEDERETPQPSAPRNYFNDDPSSLSVLDKVLNPLHDPAILAALVKKSKEKEDEEDEATKKESERKAALVRARDRDLEDMDMGFGASRFEDEEEMAMEGSKIKLSEWNDGKGDAYYDDDGKGEKKQRKRKRKGDKKGDKHSVADVLRVIESRGK